MTAAVDPVQVQHARFQDTEEREVVTTLILRLLDDGITNHSDIACRVWQTAPNFPLAELSSLMNEVCERWRSGAATPAVPTSEPTPEFPTSEVGIPGSTGPAGLVSVLSFPKRNVKTNTLNPAGPVDPDYPGIPTSEVGNSRVPLGDHLVACVERGRQERSKRLWSSPLFFFLRLARVHADLAGLTPQDAFQRIETALGALTAPACPWRHAFGLGRAAAAAEVYALWETIRCLPGQSLLAGALERARKYPTPMPAQIVAKRPPGYPEFISLASWLQSDRPEDGTILLPVEELARLLDVTTTTITRYRRWAVEDGYLQEIKPHEFRGRGKRGRATEFRFCDDGIVERFASDHWVAGR